MKFRAKPNDIDNSLPTEEEESKINLESDDTKVSILNINGFIFNIH